MLPIQQPLPASSLDQWKQLSIATTQVTLRYTSKQKRIKERNESPRGQAIEA